MFPRLNRTCTRTGGVYIAVLGTSLIVALLGMAALIGQRIQNRMLAAAIDIRQAQLNADTAIDLALLAMKSDASWRSTNPNGNWFTNRDLDAGSCTLSVTDPVDSNLGNSADDPITVLGIGYSGLAEQRTEVTLDPRKNPLACLRSAIAVGGNIQLSGDTLRTNGLVTADDIDAATSLVFGIVEALTIGGSTYTGTTTQVTSSDRPQMPDWTTVFNYYRTNGTQLNVPVVASTPNLGRNVTFETDTQYWTGSATGLPTATIARATNIGGHSACLHTSARPNTTAGPSQYIDHFIKPGAAYNITIQCAATSIFGNVFRVKLATKGSGAVQTSASVGTVVVGTGWTNVSVTLTAPSWSGDLEYARITVDTEHALGRTDPFYIDNLDIRESTSGRLISRQVLSPSINPFGATNAQGIYWIDCAGSRLVIERSRILGTLLIINPGPNSCIDYAPINWAPAVAGYPALLVDADTATDANFSIRATNRSLNEADLDVNFNPAGAPYEFNNWNASSTDSSLNDIYPSEIRGLVVIRNDLSYQNRPYIRGQVIVGGDITNSSGELEVDYQPDSLLNPPPGFLAPYSYARRPYSVRKVVLP
jgi:hypothetical protein